jgi:hypothetical protein
MRINYATAMALLPETVEELKVICRDIYDAIAMDAFGINGATDKDEYVNVIADHLSWSDDTLMSDEARKLYHHLTFDAQLEMVGQTYPGHIVN